MDTGVPMGIDSKRHGTKNGSFENKITVLRGDCTEKERSGSIIQSP